MLKACCSLRTLKDIIAFFPDEYGTLSDKGGDGLFLDDIVITEMIWTSLSWCCSWWVMQRLCWKSPCGHEHWSDFGPMEIHI